MLYILPNSQEKVVFMALYFRMTSMLHCKFSLACTCLTLMSGVNKYYPPILCVLFGYWRSTDIQFYNAWKAFYVYSFLGVLQNKYNVWITYWVSPVRPSACLWPDFIKIQYRSLYKSYKIRGLEL